MEEHENEESPDEGSELSHMSPAELEALQKKNCVFCHIASGRVPARKVYEDSECLAVLDINPATPGHMLLMPKEHYAIMFQAPEATLSHLLIVAKGLSKASLKALQTKGTTIFAANGTSAGQRAPHFMLHVIPRTAGENIGLYIPSRALAEPEAEKIAAAVTIALGGKAPSAKSESHNAEKAATEAKKEEKRGKEQKEELNLDHITDFLTKGGKK